MQQTSEPEERRLNPPDGNRSAIRNYLSGYVGEGHGVLKMSTVRFFVVLFIYLAAFVILAMDPFFKVDGVFSYRQGIVTMFFAFAVSAALNWELLLFGRASGANMLLQVLQIPPLTLLLARLTAFPSRPADVPVVKQVLIFLQSLEKEWIGLLEFIPEWLADLFSNWRISLCFILVLFILSFRNLRLKIGLLILVLVVLFASALANKPSGWLIAGAVLLIVGYSLQFCRYDRVLFFENAVRRLARSGSCDSLQASVIFAVLSAFYETGRVSRPRLQQIVRSVYAKDRPLSGADLQLIAGEIARRMVFQYDLADIHYSGEGDFLLPNPRLFAYDNLLRMVAVAPRAVLILVFALLWIALPVDLIPDGIPVLGVLDDTAVTIMTGLAVQHALPVFKMSSAEKTQSISQS